MKKFWLIFILALISIANMDAQSSKSKSKSGSSSKKNVKKEKVTFKDKLWYGGSFVLNYSSQDNYGVFQFGLVPMVGYKILPWLSVGPRAGGTFVTIKGPSNQGISRARMFDSELGGFTRIKVYNAIYLQGELGTRSIGYPLFGNVGTDNKVPIARERRTDTLIGGGYATGGGALGTDFSILYNIAAANSIDPNRYNESPLVFRFGLTYKF